MDGKGGLIVSWLVVWGARCVGCFWRIFGHYALTAVWACIVLFKPGANAITVKPMLTW